MMRKTTLFILLMFSILITVNAQSRERWKNDLFRFISRNYRISDEIRNDCYFNYAVLLFETDNKGLIRQVEALHLTDKVRADSFEFLKGYKFLKDRDFGNRPVLLFALFDQQRLKLPDCTTPYPLGSNPAAIFTDALQYIARQLKRDPRTIVIYDTLTFGIYDPSH